MRVTIGQLTEDLTPFTKQGDEAMNIEIVPRKIVEDIIEHCLKSGEVCYDTGMSLTCQSIQERFFARSRTYEGIAQFAHELLEKFEGEDTPHTCRHCEYSHVTNVKDCIYCCEQRSCGVRGEDTCEEWKERIGE